MAVESADDRAILLNDFGIAVEYNGNDFIAIFDNDYEAVDGLGTVPVALLRPRILCRSADVSSVSIGDTLTIENADYKAVVIMDDGTGMTEMMLEAQ